MIDPAIIARSIYLLVSIIVARAPSRSRTRSIPHLSISSTTRKPGHCTDNRDDSEKEEKGGETKKKQEEKGSRSDVNPGRSMSVRVVYSF
jgi:hypothetical protein